MAGTLIGGYASDLFVVTTSESDRHCIDGRLVRDDGVGSRHRQEPSLPSPPVSSAWHVSVGVGCKDVAELAGILHSVAGPRSIEMPICYRIAARRKNERKHLLTAERARYHSAPRRAIIRPRPHLDSRNLRRLFGISQRCPAALLHTWVTDMSGRFTFTPDSTVQGLLVWFCAICNGSCRCHGEGCEYGPRYYAIAPDSVKTYSPVEEHTPYL